MGGGIFLNAVSSIFGNFQKFSKKELTATFEKSLIEIFPLNGSSLKFTLCD